MATTSNNNSNSTANTTTNPNIWKASDGPRRIEVSVTVQSVENINTRQETVDVGLLLDVYWLPSSEELVGGKSAWNFHDNFQTVNAISDTERHVRKEPSLAPKGGITKWCAQLWICASFKQKFSLKHYPLDSQQILVRFEMGKITDMIYTTVEDQDVVLTIEKELCPFTGWIWKGANVVFTATNPSLSKQGNSYAQMILVFNIARDWTPYLWRVGILNFLLTLSSIIPFVLNPIDEVDTRLSVAMTILLTQVAFVLTIQNDLPKAPYMSLLEVYIFAAILFNFWVLFETAIIKGMDYKLGINWLDVDNVVALIHIAAIVLVHVLLLVVGIRRRNEGLQLLDRIPGGSGSSLPAAPQENLKVSATRPKWKTDTTLSGRNQHQGTFQTLIYSS